MGKTASIGCQAQRVLKALGRGGRFDWRGEDWACAGVVASLHTICELERRRLVTRAAAGLRLTPAGETWCARQAEARTARRGDGSGGESRDGGESGSGGGATRRRLLVERPQPDGAGDGGARSGRAAVRSVTVNLGESSLGWLAARGMISERQLVAGEQLRADWTRAGLESKVTMRWDALGGGRSRQRGGAQGVGDESLARIEARRRFDAALAAAGAGLGDILWRVACAGEGLAQAETGLGWPKRSAKLVLGLALDRVAEHYRVA